MSNFFLTPCLTLSFHLIPVVPRQDTEAPGCLYSTRSPRVLILSAGRGSPDPPPLRTGGSLWPRHSGDPAGSRWRVHSTRARGPGCPAPAEGCGESGGVTASPPYPRCRGSSFHLETPRDSGTAPRARPAPCPDSPGAVARQRRCRTASLRCDAHAATMLPKPVPATGWNRTRDGQRPLETAQEERAGAKRCPQGLTTAPTNSGAESAGAWPAPPGREGTGAGRGGGRGADWPGGGAGGVFSRAGLTAAAGNFGSVRAVAAVRAAGTSGSGSEGAPLTAAVGSGGWRGGGGRAAVALGALCWRRAGGRFAAYPSPFSLVRSACRGMRRLQAGPARLVG